MSTKFLSPGWRMPRNANQSKQSNYSMDFDGSSYIDVEHLNLTGAFSLSFWANYTTTGNGINIISQNQTSQATFGMYQLTDGKIRFWVTSSGSYNASNEITANTATNNGNWNNIILINDGTNLKIYINGSLDNSSSNGVSSPYNGTANFWIGGSQAGGAKFEGKLNAVSIFDYALSPSQVTTLWGGGTSVSNPMALPSPPIAYYPLGTSAWNGEYLAENNAIGDYVFDFDGSTSYVTTSVNPGNYSALTASAWINFDSTTGRQSVFSQYQDNTNNVSSMWMLWNVVSNELWFFIIDSSNVFKTAKWTSSNSFTLTTGNWYNVVGIWDGSYVKVYVNGEAGSYSDAATSLNSSSLDFLIGSGMTSGGGIPYDEFNGKISNVQIFDTALTGPEVTTLYNYGSPIQTLASIPQNSNLKAWYKLDASEVYNSSTTEWIIDNNQNPSAYSSGLKCTSSNYLRLNAGYETPQILSDVPNKLSLSFWINAPSGQGGNMYFFSRSANQIIINSSTNNNLSYSIYPGTGSVTGGSILDGSWHHCVMVYDFSNTSLACYEDGVLIQKVTNASVLASRKTAMILCTFGAGAGNSLEATVSNFCIWEDALSDGSVSAGQVAGGDVATLFNNGVPLQEMSSGPKYSTLRAWWKFDNLTSGLLDNKNSFNASTQIVSGQTTPVAEYPGFVNTLAGDSSGMSQANLVQSDLQTVAPYSKYALNFDKASNDYISLPNSTDYIYSNNEFTFSVWFYKTVTTTTTIFSKGSAGNGQHLLFFFPSTNTLRADFYNSGATGDFSYIFDNDKWYHVALCRSGSNVTLYVNGGSAETITPTYANGNITSGNTYIGKYYSQTVRDWGGKLSNCSVWNTALTSSQVTEIYNEGLPSDLNSHSAYSNLVSWWQLGENSSFATNWIVADEKGTNNGTSANMGVDALTNGVGTTANGVSSGMSEGNLVGDAPYSTDNAISSGMSVVSRVSGSGNTP